MLRVFFRESCVKFCARMNGDEELPECFQYYSVDYIEKLGYDISVGVISKYAGAGKKDTDAAVAVIMI